MDTSVFGSSGRTHTDLIGRLSDLFSWWLIWSVAGLLFVAAFSVTNAQDGANPAPIPAEAQSNHIIVLVDQSGSFQRLLGYIENQLVNLINTALPNILTNTELLGRESIYRKDKDVLSVMLFGITTEHPDIDLGLLRDVLLFEDNTRLEDISRSTLGWRDKKAGLSAISAVFGSALDRIGREYHRLNLETVFNKTYLVRISDDIQNSSGGYYSELTTIQLFRNEDLFPPDVLGFDVIYQKLSACDSHVEIMNPDHTWRVCLSKRGKISWSESDYFTPSGAYPVKVLITEARPRAHISFDAIFESRTPAELKHYTKRPVSVDASFRLRPEYVQGYRELAPLGWRQDILYSDDLLWEYGGLGSLFIDSTVEFVVAGKGDALPVSMGFTAFFGRTDRYLGRGLFSIKKQVVYHAEKLNPTDRMLMSIWPVEGMSSDWVLAIFTAILLFIVLVVIFAPHRTVLSIEPLQEKDARAVIDLDDKSEHPIIVGYADRRDTNYHRPRIRLAASLKDFFYDLSDSKIGAALRFDDGVAKDEDSVELRNSIEPALPGPVHKHRFRSDEVMALRLLPGSIADLSQTGFQWKVPTGSVTRDSSVDLDISGRFGWQQGSRPTKYSKNEFKASLVLRPRRNHANVEVDEVGPIEFASGRKQVIAVVSMESIFPGFNYITDMDVCLEAELEARGTYLRPDLSFEVIPSQVAVIASELRASLEESRPASGDSDNPDPALTASLDKVGLSSRIIMAERAFSLNSASSIQILVVDIISELRNLIKQEFPNASWTSREVTTEPEESLESIEDPPTELKGGADDGIESGVQSDTDDSGLEDVLARIEPKVRGFLEDRLKLLAEPKNDSEMGLRSDTTSLDDAVHAGDTDEDKAKAESYGPHTIKDIKGRIPSGGLQFAVTTAFAELKNIRRQIDYELHFQIPRGRDQLSLPRIGMKKSEGMPAVKVTIVPSRKLATPRLDYVTYGEKLKIERVENLLRFRRDDIIDVTPAGLHPLIAQPPGRKWQDVEYPTIVLGNHARSGDGEVAYNIEYKKATVVTDIQSLNVANLRNLIQVHHSVDSSRRGDNTVENLTRMTDRTYRYSSTRGDAQMKLRFSITPASLDFPADEDYVTAVLTVPLTMKWTNWKAKPEPEEDDQYEPEQRITEDGTSLGMDLEAPRQDRESEIDHESSGEEKLELKIPFVLHKEPTLGILAVDIGASAFAAAYTEGHKKAKPKVLELQKSRMALDGVKEFFINNEPEGSPFLSGPIGVCSPKVRGSFAAIYDDYIGGAIDAAFPAIKKFGDHPAYLVPHLKMLLASGAADVKLGPIKDPDIYAIQDLLDHALGRLLKDFVLPQVQEALGQGKDEALGKLRRIVMSVPNTALGHQTGMLRQALSSVTGFRFAEEYVDFLSESDAAACGYLYGEENLDGLGNSFTLLVYDCGAGTLDLSLRKVTIKGRGNKRRVSSSLINLLSIKGAGNALDGKIMECVGDVLRDANTVKELKKDHGFSIRYFPFETKKDIQKRRIPEDSWREYLDIVKRNLYWAKDKLSRNAAGKDKDRDDLKLEVGFEPHPYRMFEIRDPGKVERGEEDQPENKEKVKAAAAIRVHGITFGPTDRNPVVVIPYETLQRKLEEADEKEGEKSFYYDHIDLPLEVLLRGEENAAHWPDLVLLTGRTALYPGFSEKLNDWFANERQDRAKIADLANGDTEKETTELSLEAVPSVPRFVSFETQPKKMKSIVVQGALKYASRGGGDFETREVYGHYGLLLQKSDHWEWVPVCSHDTIADDGVQTSFGGCSISSVNSISFVYSSIDPSSLIRKYKAKSLEDGGPLEAYHHFLKEYQSAENDEIKALAVGDAALRGGAAANSVEFYRILARLGGGRVKPLSVGVQLRVGSQNLNLTADLGGVVVGQEQYSVWPYMLWVEEATNE